MRQAIGEPTTPAAVRYEQMPPDESLARLVECLTHLKSQLEPDWADLALAGGFGDQAHLIHECVTLAGATPGQLRRERGRVGFLQYRMPEMR